MKENTGLERIVNNWNYSSLDCIDFSVCFEFNRNICILISVCILLEIVKLYSHSLIYSQWPEEQKLSNLHFQWTSLLSSVVERFAIGDRNHNQYAFPHMNWNSCHLYFTFQVQETGDSTYLLTGISIIRPITAKLVKKVK